MAEISAAVKSKYKMKAGFAPGEYRFKGETIDTSKCTLEELNIAVKNGFDVVTEVEPAKTGGNK